MAEETKAITDKQLNDLKKAIKASIAGMRASVAALQAQSAELDVITFEHPEGGKTDNKRGDRLISDITDFQPHLPPSILPTSMLRRMI